MSTSLSSYSNTVGDEEVPKSTKGKRAEVNAQDEVENTCIVGGETGVDVFQFSELPAATPSESVPATSADPINSSSSG